MDLPKKTIVPKRMDGLLDSSGKFYVCIVHKKFNTRNVIIFIMNLQIEQALKDKAGIKLADYEVQEDQMVTCKSGSRDRFDYVLINKRDHGKTLIRIIDDNLELEMRFIFSYKYDCEFTDAIIISNITVKDSDINLAKSLGIKLIENISQSGIASFGLPKLDAVLKGGLIPERVYMISGESGTGKTILASKFILEGADEGQKGIIILTSTPVKNFLVDMMTIFPKFDTYYKSGMINIYSLSEQVNELKSQSRISDVNYKKMLTKLVSQIKDILLKENAKRLLIDNVSLILMPDDDYISSFFNTPPTGGLTTVVTSQIRANKLSYYGIEEFYVSGIIRLTKEFINDELVRRLFIEKMRGINYDSKPVEFTLDQNGIEFI